MAKKKNYVTRDNDGYICLWVGCIKEPQMNSEGDYNSAGYTCLRIINRDVCKVFIGILPRKGTCREFKRGEK